MARQLLGPSCSVCGTECINGEAEWWFCPMCGSEWSIEHHSKYAKDGDAVQPSNDPATVPRMTLDENTARELSRAAKNVATWTEKRNQLIRDALAAGGGVREVARAVDLAPATVLNIQRPKNRGGTPRE